VNVTYLTVHMIPPTSTPPLHLVILLAKDSPGVFDAPPSRVEREGNGLETAVRKFRMAAYLWQAFTAEQMYRNRLGRRTVRFEEEWTVGSVGKRDWEVGVLRSEARVHVIRSEKTIAELRDPERAQQNENAGDKGGLFGIAADAVRDYFKPSKGQKIYAAVLLLDAHWDVEKQLITGHAALGGSVGNLHLAVFGSHCLWSYPSCLEDVIPSFTDCTPTDTSHVANDCGDAPCAWEALCLGVGAHLHEVGHALGLPHRDSGVMARDWRRLNRVFVVREGFSARTKSRGGFVGELEDGEGCSWHRLDCLRLRSHALLRLPNDAGLGEPGVEVWVVEEGTVVVTAGSGLQVVEVYDEGEEVCRVWIEYLPSAPGEGPLRMVTLTEGELRARLRQGHPKYVGKEGPKGTIKIVVRSCAGGAAEIEDFGALVSRETSVLRLTPSNSNTNSTAAALGSMLPGSAPPTRTAFKGKKVGQAKLEGSEPVEVVFASALPRAAGEKGVVLSKVVVYHGAAVDGVEFVYDDGGVQLLGRRGGKGEGFEMGKSSLYLFLFVLVFQLEVGIGLRIGLGVLGLA